MKTAHNHRREEPAHQIVHFILGRPFIVADLFSHDGIERESVESRQAVGKAKVGRDAQNAADNCGHDAHTNQTYDDQRKHRSNQVKEHGRRAVGQAGVITNMIKARKRKSFDPVWESTSGSRKPRR